MKLYEAELCSRSSTTQYRAVHSSCELHLIVLGNPKQLTTALSISEQPSAVLVRVHCIRMAQGLTLLDCVLLHLCAYSFLNMSMMVMTLAELEVEKANALLIARSMIARKDGCCCCTCQSNNLVELEECFKKDQIFSFSSRNRHPPPPPTPRTLATHANTLPTHGLRLIHHVLRRP